MSENSFNKIRKYIDTIADGKATLVLSESPHGHNFVRFGGVCVMFELEPLLYNFSAEYTFGTGENYQNNLSALKEDVDRAEKFIAFLIAEFKSCKEQH